MKPHHRAPSAPAVLRIRRLCIEKRAVERHVTGNRTLIDALSMNIEAGTCFGLVGESGSGKTLTALAIANALPRTVHITSGHIEAPPRISMVFQDARAALNPVRRIGRQFADVLKANGMPRQAHRDHTLDWLGKLGFEHPEDCFERYPFELSGGMCQRILIALALARRPALLIADEITSGLDPYNQRMVLQALFTLTQQHGIGVLFITHDVQLAIAHCATIGVLQHGKLCEITAAHNFVKAATHPYSRALITAMPALQQVLHARKLVEPSRFDKVIQATRVAQAAQATQATQLAQATPSPALRTSASSILRVINLGKRFASRALPALENISFDVPRASVTGIIGKSGSGKSTLAAGIARLIDMDTGSILFNDVDIAAISAQRAASASWRRDVQLIFQDARASLNPLATCRQAIAAAFHRLPEFAKNASEINLRIDMLAEQVGLPLPLLEQLPHRISGGEASRVVIARALASEPTLLILDEATVSLDQQTQAETIDLIDRLRRQHTMSLLWITHDMALVRMLCDHVIVLDAGRVVEQGPCAALLNAPLHAATRQLLSPGSVAAGQA